MTSIEPTNYGRAIDGRQLFRILLVDSPNLDKLPGRREQLNVLLGSPGPKWNPLVLPDEPITKWNANRAVHAATISIAISNNSAPRTYLNRVGRWLKAVRTNWRKGNFLPHHSYLLWKRRNGHAS